MQGIVVGRIIKVGTPRPFGTPWMCHEDRTPTHGYEPTREAAMTAFAKSWRRQYCTTEVRAPSILPSLK